MILTNSFNGSTKEYDKRCKMRIGISAGIILLGFAALMVAFLYGDKIPTFYKATPDALSFINGFYTGIGGGLIAAGIITIIKNIRILRNPELKKERALYENDERNQLIGTKCWAYSGYAMFLFLYVGILVGGFISMTVLKVLLCVLAAYGGFLLLFRILLQKMM